MSPLSRRSLLKHLFKMSAAGLLVPSTTRYFFMGDPVRRVLTQGLTPALVEVPFNDYIEFLRPSVGSISMELDPVGSPGVFTTIAELTGSLPAHPVIHNILGSGPITFSINYIFDDKGGKVPQ